MTTLTLIYAADSDGKLTDQTTGKCWNIPADRKFFRTTIAGKPIICGRKTYEQDFAGLKGAKEIVVLTHKQSLPKIPGESEFRAAANGKGNCAWVFQSASPIEALAALKLRHKKEPEIYCVGGKETIEAFAPFASRVLVTAINAENDYEPWLPGEIAGLKEYSSENENGFPTNEFWSAESCTPLEYNCFRYDYRRALPIEF